MAVNVADLSQQQIEIIAEIVTDDERHQFIPTMFGGELGIKNWFVIDMVIIEAMQTMSKDYTSGILQYYRLSNGGCYVEPTPNKEYLIEIPHLNYKEKMSKSAFGIAASLFVFKFMFGITHNKIIENYFLLLREYALCHHESSKILRCVE